MWFSVLICSVLVLNVVCAEYLLLVSPCPEIFEYSFDGRGVYGVIKLRNAAGPIPALMLRANFTIATRLPSSYVGRIEATSGNLVTFNSGSVLQYRVDFPVTAPVPKLASLSANDKVICYGQPDIATPQRYVTTISLQHTLYLKGQGSNLNQFDKPQLVHQPDKDLDFLANVPQDAQIFMVTEDANHQLQFDPVSRPQLDQTLQEISRPPNRRPDPPVQFLPEVNTQRPPQKPPQYYPEVTEPPQYPEKTTQPPTTAKPQTTSPVTELPVRQQDIISSINTAVQCGVVAGNEHQPLIFNGAIYPRGEWPWVVAIYKRKDGSLSFICSGTLISDRHVVSAAHCMHLKNSITSKKDIVVKVGVYNLEDWGDDITVTRTLASAKIHERYNSTSLSNDILVLTMERSVEFNTNIRPACLWSGNPDQSRIVGASGVVAGWGQSEIGPEGQGEPRIARIPVVSTAACRASRPDFHKLTSEFTLCAGDRNGIGPCLGDSGGGFYLLEGGRWQLRGVVSLSLRPENGDNTCNLNEYIVFTDAARYIDWIRSAIGR